MATSKQNITVSRKSVTQREQRLEGLVVDIYTVTVGNAVNSLSWKLDMCHIFHLFNFEIPTLVISIVVSSFPNDLKLKRSSVSAWQTEMW